MRSIKHGVLGVSVSMCLSGLVYGQVGSDSRSTASALLEEVVVLGTKKSAGEASQDVAAQIAVFDSSNLEARQFSTLVDLSYSTPSVALNEGGPVPGFAQFSIRGSGATSTIPSLDPTVATFVNGVYLGTGYGVVADTYDLESVEIYKGPQGLLFGKNANGGAVLMRTKRPSGEFSADFKVGYETAEQVTVAGAIEGALGNSGVAGRVSGYWSDDGGYFENTVSGDDVGKQRAWLIRPTVLFQPNDTSSHTLMLEAGGMDGHGQIPQDTRGASADKPRNGISTVTDDPGYLDLEWQQATLESSWDVLGGVMTNILAYRAVDSDTYADIDGLPFHLFHGQLTLEQDQLSNELRYNGSVGDSAEIIAGIYYFEQEVEYRELRDIPPAGGLIAGGGDQDHTVLGAFISSDIYLTQNITANLGIRYTREEKDANVYPLGLPFCNTATLECNGVPLSSDDWSSWAPKIGLEYAVSDDSMVYALWSRAFRSGGFNFRSANPIPVATDQEQWDNYELGFKSDHMGGALRFNGAFFFLAIDNSQREVQITDPVLGIVQEIANTANIETYGIEAELTWAVTDSFVLTAGLGYNHGEYTDVFEDINGDGVVDGIDAALDIPQLYEWTGSIGAIWDINVPGGVLSLRANYGHRSETPFTDDNEAWFNEYDIVDVGATYFLDDAGLSVAFFGKNITDEAQLGGTATLPFGPFGASYYAPLTKGERYGVEVSYAF